jgi:hypothetical protein
LLSTHATILPVQTWIILAQAVQARLDALEADNDTGDAGLGGGGSDDDEFLLANDDEDEQEGKRLLFATHDV